MSETAPIADGETGFDRVLAFSVPDLDARGRVVRLGPVLDTVLSAHDYPAPVAHLLAEALVLTALMGALLKEEDSQLTIQAQAEDGAVEMLVCDYRKGELRGYVRHDPERLGKLGANPTLAALFGKGFLAITFDLAVTDERYQGVVSLEGDSLAQVCESYFVKSEQVPTLLKVAVRTQGGRHVAAGLLVQHLPEGEEGRARLHVEMEHPHWEHVSTLAGSIRHEELVDPALSMEDIVWRLFNQEKEVRAHPLSPLVRGCRCTADYYQSVLSRFPETERAEMRDDEGLISIDCAFCSKIFRVAA